MPGEVWVSTINPPAQYSPWWWAGAAACLLVAVAVVLWARRRLRPSTRAAGENWVETARAEALARLQDIGSRAARGELSVQSAAASTSTALRRFVGLVTSVDADYLVLPELRRAAAKDSRLDPVVQLVASLESVSFRPAGPNDPDVTSLVDGTREVVTSWN